MILGSVQYMIGPAIATFTRSTGPLIATAIHAGSFMRSSLLNHCQLSRAERLREEDPFTEHLAQISGNRVIGERSRFEVDLNRPRNKAIYMRPEDAWGLHVYNDLPKEEIGTSLALYDEFHREMARMIDALLRENDRLVIFDIHSYNHQREGEGIYAEQVGNPDVNIGTDNLSRVHWSGVVDHLIACLRRPLSDGTQLDVRENIKFRGGNFGRWLYERYGEKVCPIALEYKKIFMNEWTGEPDMGMIGRLRAHLENAATEVVKNLHGTTALR